MALDKILKYDRRRRGLCLSCGVDIAFAARVEEEGVVKLVCPECMSVWTKEDYKTPFDDPKPDPQVMQILMRYENAVRDHAFRGAQDPASWPDIDQEYHDTKQMMIKLLTGGGGKDE